MIKLNRLSLLCGLALWITACKTDATKETVVKAEHTTDEVVLSDEDLGKAEFVKVIDTQEDIVLLEPEPSPEPEPAVEQKPSPSQAEQKASAPKAKPKRKKKAKKAKPKPVLRKAKISFEETEHKFGEITEGDIVEHDFVFTNTGKADLNVLEADVTCGCTYPSFPFLAIAPGEQGHIGVRFNSVGKDGPQKATVTLTTDASNKVVELHMVGLVKPKPKSDKDQKSIKTDSVGG